MTVTTGFTMYYGTGYVSSINYIVKVNTAKALNRLIIIVLKEVNR